MPPPTPPPDDPVRPARWNPFLPLPNHTPPPVFLKGSRRPPTEQHGSVWEKEERQGPLGPERTLNPIPFPQLEPHSSAVSQSHVVIGQEPVIILSGKKIDEELQEEDVLIFLKDPQSSAGTTSSLSSLRRLLGGRGRSSMIPLVDRNNEGGEITTLLDRQLGNLQGRIRATSIMNVDPSSPDVTFYQAWERVVSEALDLGARRLVLKLDYKPQVCRINEAFGASLVVYSEASSRLEDIPVVILVEKTTLPRVEKKLKKCFEDRNRSSESETDSEGEEHGPQLVVRSTPRRTPRSEHGSQQRCSTRISGGKTPERVTWLSPVTAHEKSDNRESVVQPPQPAVKEDRTNPISYGIRGLNKNSRPVQIKYYDPQAPPNIGPVRAVPEPGKGQFAINTEGDQSYANEEAGNPYPNWYPVDGPTAAAIRGAKSREEILLQPGWGQPFKNAYLGQGYDYYRGGCVARDTAVKTHYYSPQSPSQLQDADRNTPHGGQYYSMARDKIPEQEYSPHWQTMQEQTKGNLGSFDHTILPQRAPGESDTAYVQRLQDRGMTVEQLSSPEISQVIALKSDLRIAPGASLMSLADSSPRGIGEDLGERKRKALSLEISTGKTTLAGCMGTISMLSQIQQEKLLADLPGGLMMAAMWPSLSPDEKIRQAQTWDRTREYKQSKNVKGRQEGNAPKIQAQTPLHPAHPPQGNQLPNPQLRQSSNQGQRLQKPLDPNARPFYLGPPGCPVPRPRRANPEEWAKMTKDERDKLIQSIKDWDAKYSSKNRAPQQQQK
ncbi:uncharacterized protein [Nothobranchius furzeri]|uniref:uncharacterized protein isoform X1 n=1 Tax=Nothobranchius furzeri TaxID=105023 RepID=UPI003904E046